MSDYKLMAYHSFTRDYPDNSILQDLSNKGWEKVYPGYSYLYQTGPNHGFGNAMHSHNSCLQEFSPIMMTQTYGEDVRVMTKNFFSVWVVDSEEQFSYNGFKVDTFDDRVKFIKRVIGKCYVFRKEIKREIQRYYYAPTQ